MKGSQKSIRESFYTFSFSPFMLTLFKEDIKRIIEITKSDFPKVTIQIGQYTLEKEINEISDIEAIAKSNQKKLREYHCLYILVQTSPKETEKPYMIIDISPSSYNLFISDSEEKKLIALHAKIKEIMVNRNIYRFFKNKIINIFVLICDVFFVLYVLFLKDIIEKLINFRIPDTLFLLAALLVNIIFIVPHGKNKIYIQEEKKVSVFKKDRETIMIGGIIAVIGIILIFSILKLFGM